MKVREIMTEPVIVINEDETLEEAAGLMLDKNIGGLPVVDGDGTLVGIITESDFAAKEHAIPFSRIYAPRLFGKWMSKEGVEKAYEAARRIKVKQIMTTAVVTVEEDDLLAEAINKMLDHHVHRVPVVRDGSPIGMISRHDLLKLIVNRIEE
ncbi:MAG: CBS domain-containing protein [Deltaproteobacteria bacterium]